MKEQVGVAENVVVSVVRSSSFKIEYALLILATIIVATSIYLLIKHYEKGVNIERNV